MRTTVSVEPNEEPVTTAEAKTHLIVSHSEDDTLIDALITAARRFVENELGRSLITRTLIVTLDAREGAPPIVLPHGPVGTVTSFEVFDDENDEWDTVAATAYYVAGDKLCMAEGSGSTSWPTADRTYDAYRITYTAGYGAAAAVPADIKRAILLTVGDLYENRETLVGSGLVVTSAPVSARILLSPYINYQLN